MLRRITEDWHMMQGRQGFTFKVKEQKKCHLASAVGGFEQQDGSCRGRIVGVQSVVPWGVWTRMRCMKSFVWFNGKNWSLMWGKIKKWQVRSWLPNVKVTNSAFAKPLSLSYCCYAKLSILQLQSALKMHTHFVTMHLQFHTEVNKSSFSFPADHRGNDGEQILSAAAS